MDKRKIQIAKVPLSKRRSLEPETLEEVVSLAKQFVSSGLMPPGISNIPQVVVVTMIGRDLGLSMAQSVKSIRVIKGKPELSSALMKALVHRSGLCDFFDCIESTAKSATYKTRRKGSTTEESFTWTIEKAVRAGLLDKTGSSWRTYPENMLRWRCVADLCRFVYPDVITDCYLPGEIEGDSDPGLEFVDTAMGAGLIETAAGPSDDMYENAQLMLSEAKSVDELTPISALIRDNLSEHSKIGELRALYTTVSRDLKKGAQSERLAGELISKAPFSEAPTDDNEMPDWMENEPGSNG